MAGGILVRALHVMDGRMCVSLKSLRLAVITKDVAEYTSSVWGGYHPPSLGRLTHMVHSLRS
jgi:hypothetical protein